MPKAAQFGLEYSDSLQFEGWAVGDTLTKNVVLKNMLFTAIRVTPTAPKSQFFTLKAKPQTVMISAGTTASFCLVFRPTDAVDYEDALEVSTPEGVVTVALTAKLPRPALTFPSAIAFPLVAVGATHVQRFPLANDSAQTVTWMLSTEGCFSVTPAGGELAPGQSTHIALTFRPTDARTHVAGIRVKMDGGITGVAPLVQTIAVSAPAMFAHVLVEGATATDVPGFVELAFERMRPAQTAARTLRLRNPTAVPAVVTVTQLATSDACFTVAVATTTITAATTTITAAKGLATKTNAAVLKVASTLSIAPSISASALTDAGDPTTTTAAATTTNTRERPLEVTVAPHSDVALAISVRAGPASVAEQFVVETRNGNRVTIQCIVSVRAPKIVVSHAALDFGKLAVGARTATPLTLTNESDVSLAFEFHGHSNVFSFSPATGAVPPQSSVTVTATCVLPQPGCYARAVTLVLTDCPAIILPCTASTPDAAPVPLTIIAPTPRPETGSESMEAPTTATPHPQRRTGTGTALPVPPRASEPKLDATSRLEPSRVTTAVTAVTPVIIEEKPLVLIDTTTLDFGACAYGSKRKVEAIGSRTVTLSNNTDGPLPVAWAVRAPFSVSPPVATIPPRSSLACTVLFQPLQGDVAFFSEAECYLGHSDENQATCLLVSLFGHTFTTTPAATVALSSPRVALPPAVIGSSAWGVFSIENPTAIALPFALTGPERVALFPTAGILPPNSSCLCAAQLSATTPGPLEPRLHCTSLTATANIALRGVFAAPQLHMLSGLRTLSSTTLDETRVVYMPPSVVGASTVAHTLLYNPTSIPLSFFITPARTSLAVSTLSGELASGQLLPLAWTHTAAEAGDYRDSASVAFVGFNLNRFSSPEEILDVEIEGTADTGLLELQGSLALGRVVLGRRSAATVTLCNTGNVSAHFKLRHNGGPSISVTPSGGYLGARSRLPLVVAALPLFEETINFTIEYAQVPSHATSQSTPATALEWSALAAGSVTGVRPQLTVTDACAPGFCRRRLAQLLDLERLNRVVFTGTATGDETSAPVAVRLVPALQGGAESEVRLLLANTGLCAADWVFQLPTELTYQPEQWAKDSRPSDHEAHLKRILENKLFSISPRSGSLASGQTAEVVITYRPTVVSVDELPVRVVVGDRTSNVTIVGETFASSAYLHFPSQHIWLADVQVGALDPPVQHYVLHNIGDADANVRVSVTCVSHPAHEELECGVSEARVPARGSAVLPLRFQPLSAGDHEFNLIVRDDSGKESVLSVVGLGADRLVVPANASAAPLAAAAAASAAADAASGSLTTTSIEGSTGLLVPRIVVPGQLATLSTELVDFGAVAHYGLERRLVTLRNVCAAPVQFSWHVGVLAGVLSVSPSSGSLAVGETRICVFAFRGSDGTRVYDFDVMLQTQSEAVLASHATANAAATEDRERAANGFTLTDAGRTGRGRAGAYDTRATVLAGPSARAVTMTSSEFPSKLLAPGFNPSFTASFSPAMQSEILLPAGGSTMTADAGKATLAGTTTLVGTTLSLGATVGGLGATAGLRKGRQGLAVTDLDLRTSKYQALPPINVPHSRTVVTPRALPPPGQQFVSVVARVYSVTELRAAGASLASTLSVDTSMAAVGRPGGSTLWASETEAAAVEETLLQIVHSVLHDADMQQAMLGLAREPVPLFCQIADVPATAVLPREEYLCLESILDNTIANILAEAEAGEFNITARTVTR